MKNRTKMIIFALIVLIIFTGIIFAQNQRKVEEQGDKFEITKNRETENMEEQIIENSEENEEENLKTESDVKTGFVNKADSETEAGSKSREAGKSETNGGDNSNSNNGQTSGMINFEELIAAHPETQTIYAEYKVEKERLQEGENTEENIGKLKANYSTIVIDKTRSDLKEFAETNNLDLLIVDDEIVLDKKDEYEDTTEVKDQTAEFKEFLNK